MIVITAIIIRLYLLKNENFLRVHLQTLSGVVPDVPYV